MKFLKFVLITIIVLVILGYGIYHFGTKVASDKLVDTISTELVNSGEMEEIKQSIENDPELMSFLEDAKSINESKLPFRTKEEATKVLIKKVGITELNDIREQVQEGTISKEIVLEKVQGKLTEEEILALKVIAYKELYNQ
ncbi:hypothetical protein E1I69_05565 [Bacillus timonensis]|uniref:Phenylalanyl-tRNA synthetase subunit beta n=1 Tax=Bacillus timonensis TaxID=1033734 RepID=A0A4S3PVW1_9BACI|nr:hypothetical protein [Bacillus timonensis]THE13969.1 hypothetical protein E1I69_05565 [Bacillus timonensis]